jgi:hypothetical protein
LNERLEHVQELRLRRRPQRVPPPQPAAGDDPRPTIQMTTELHEVVDAGIAALSQDNDLYKRDGYLAHVVRSDGDDELVAWEPGTPQIRLAAAATLRERLTRVARWEKFESRSASWKPALPGNAIVDAALARGEWRGVRPLVGVIEAPSFRADGSIIDEPGYDRATGYLFCPNATFEPVPPAPTREDAVRAFADLAEVFCDFPYRAPLDRDVAIACLLTVLARPMIRGSVPAFVFDASVRGSGKSLQTDAIALIATGRGAARMSWPANDEELEKVLGAYALRGAALVSFDNISRPFGGAPLDRCLTAIDRVELRVLGKSQVPALHWRAVVLGTGNNILVPGDTTRRVLLSRLQPDVDRPEDRPVASFRHPELLEWVRQERPRLVRSAMTMIAALVAAGLPKSGPGSWGSFEAWAAVVPQAIAFAGGADVLAARPSEAEGHDPEAAALVAILDAFARLDPAGMTTKNLVELLYSQERLRGQAPPDGYDEARQGIEALVPTRAGYAPDATRLGNALRRHRDRIVDGRRLVSKPGRAGVVRWSVQGQLPPRT